MVLVVVAHHAAVADTVVDTALLLMEDVVAMALQAATVHRVAEGTTSFTTVIIPKSLTDSTASVEPTEDVAEATHHTE